MPGVSTKTSWAAPFTVMPRTRRRVVWTLAVTIETLVPTSRLSRVDLPTLGAPNLAGGPARLVRGHHGVRPPQPPPQRLWRAEGDCRARRPPPRCARRP